VPLASGAHSINPTNKVCFVDWCCLVFGKEGKGREGVIKNVRFNRF
jgi:hypothetical protein